MDIWWAMLSGCHGGRIKCSSFYVVESGLLHGHRGVIVTYSTLVLASNLTCCSNPPTSCGYFLHFLYVDMLISYTNIALLSANLCFFYKVK